MCFEKQNGTIRKRTALALIAAGIVASRLWLRRHRLKHGGVVAGVPVLPAASLAQLSSVAWPPAHTPMGQATATAAIRTMAATRRPITAATTMLIHGAAIERPTIADIRRPITAIATVVPFGRHSRTTPALIRAVSFVTIVGIAITGEQAWVAWPGGVFAPAFRGLPLYSKAMVAA